MISSEEPRRKDSGSRALVRSMGALSWAAAGAVYRAGDRLQEAVVDLVFDTLEEELSPRRWLRAGMRLLDDSARAMSLALPAETGVPWLELHTKLEAFRGFDGVESSACNGERTAAQHVPIAKSNCFIINPLSVRSF